MKVSSAQAASRLARLYCGYQFFFSLLLWLPVFYEFQKRIGLGDAQIFSIQSAYYLAFCLFEIPTGWFGDRFGYLKCLRSGAILLVVANLLPVFFASSAGMLTHFLAIALSRSLVSGAGSAHLYEGLSRLGEVSRYKQVEGNARAYGLLGKVVLWLFVGKLMEWRLDSPYLLTAALTSISVVYAYLLKPLEPLPKQLLISEAVLGNSFNHGAPRSQSLLSVLHGLKQSPLLLALMFQGIGLFVLTRIVQVNLFQPILSSKRLDLALYGAVLSTTSVFEAVGSARSGGLRKWIGDREAVFALTATMAAVLFMLPWLGRGGTWLGLGVFSLAIGFATPIQRQLINDAIPDGKYRATFLSLESILDRGACSWVAAYLSAALVHSGLDHFLWISAIFSLATVVSIQTWIAYLARAVPALDSKDRSRN